MKTGLKLTKRCKHCQRIIREHNQSGFCSFCRPKYHKKKVWKIGERHKIFGEVIGMGIKDGEAYRFFKEKSGTISLIPLPVLNYEDNK